MKTVNSFAYLASTLMAITPSLACLKLKTGNFEEDKASTTLAISRLHEQFSAGRFDEIYAGASEPFRMSRDPQTALAAMKMTREQFGAFRQMTYSQMNVIVGAPVQIRAVYNSEFKKGPATELFTFLKEEEGPRLADYEIHAGTVKP